MEAICDGLVNFVSENVHLPPSWMFGAATRAVDRYTPGVEKILLPAKTYPQITMKVWVELNSMAVPEQSRMKLLASIRSPKVEFFDLRFCDFRFHSPENWAHAIFYHIPLARKIISHFDEGIIFLLPPMKNRKIVDLYNLFNVKIYETNKSISGRQVKFDKSKIEIATLNRRDWIEDEIKNLYEGSPENRKTIFPKKVFANRRDTRRLINQNVREYLFGEGFHEVFPEDYSALDQIKIFDQANEIVGIHGAGLAPLLLRRDKKEKKALIGLMPAVQVTSGFRLLCYQSSVDWVGVRGKISSNFADRLTESNPPPLSWSHRNFEVCVESLKTALEHTRSEG
jgi:hypothetical protein